MGLLFFFVGGGGGTLTLPLPAVLFSNITDNMEDFILTLYHYYCRPTW